jgi:two-component system, sensor histidine kinase RegB
MELHLSGMLVAQAVTAACFVAFAGWLQRALRRREAELTQARAEMARQERFASLALLAAGAAHELGTPLNTIAVAAAEVARVAREEAVPAELGEDAELIREEVARCRGILGRLQQEHVDRAEPVAAGELLAEMSRRLGAEAERVHLEPAAGLPPLRVPREAAVQALLSLTRNALDASPPGRPVQVHATREGKGIRLEVLDEGAGLSPEAAAHAGEPFFSTKPPQQGMGLGLFLVRLLAAQVGGSFVLDARPGGGTRARLDLPAEGA